MKYQMDSKKIKVIKKMTKTIGIGYTLYEYDGKTKRSISMTKAHPGNIKQELSRIEKKISKMVNSNKKLYDLCIWTGLYGFVFRVFLEMIR